MDKTHLIRCLRMKKERIMDVNGTVIVLSVGIVGNTEEHWYRLERLLGELYKNQKVVVRVNGEATEPEKVNIERGVRQGCPMPPVLFNIYAEKLLEKVEKEI
uniref:Uncharacterized protein n=1 Tax=Photinus pyralis TaxID=7054 RepID=A0A1Y1K7E1_PHOPY